MRLLFCCCFAFCFVACNDVEIGNAKDVDPESIYYDYKITGDEGSNEVTVKLHYRFGGPNGTTLVLNEPSKVSLDGKALKVDSAKYSGAFYEITQPVESFKGKHTIVFTDRDKKEHKEEFEFQPFTLMKGFPEKIKKKPFDVHLNNFPLAPTPVRLVMTDTSFNSFGVNDEITIEKAVIHIDESKLSKLTKGPVTLEIYREDEKPIHGSKQGGKISVSYGLKREFELVE